MKLSQRYKNRLCKFYLNDHSEECGIVNPFFMSKYGNKLFLLRVSDIQKLEKEVGVESALIDFDKLSDVLISKYFHEISEESILLGKTLHEPSVYDKLLGGQTEVSEKVDLVLFEIELKFIDFFKSRETSDPFEEHDRLFLHRVIVTDPPHISLKIDDAVPEYIRLECYQAYKDLFKGVE